MMTATLKAAPDVAATTESSVKAVSYLTVYAGQHVYGLSVKEAETVFRVGQITPIPLSHRDVAGFLNLRGKIVVAVSLARRLEIAPTGGRELFAIGLEAANEHFALLVDRVGDVLDFPASAKTAFPMHYTGRESVFMRDMYLHDCKHTPILDIDRLFDFSI